MLVSIVVAKWSKDLFEVFITFWVVCTTIDDYQDFFAKMRLMYHAIFMLIVRECNLFKEKALD
jgi:hypothetical protein